MKLLLIENITSHHLRKLKKYINKVAIDFEPEDIHRFRVEYKKYRAFVRMAAAGNKLTEERFISKELKKAFRISGAVRDLQILHQRVIAATGSGFRKPKGFLFLLNIDTSILQAELKKIIKRNPVAASKKKIAHIPSKTLPSSRFRKYALSQWKAIAAIVSKGNFSDDAIHSIRKLLKDVFYNQQILQPFNLDLFSHGIWKEKTALFYHDFLLQLGSFQDKSMEIDLMKRMLTNQLNEYDYEFIVNQRKEWIREKQGLKKVIVGRLKKGINAKPPVV